LEREALAVRTVAQDRGVLAIVRAVDIRAQHQPIVHAHGYVPVDFHCLYFGGGVKGPVMSATFCATARSSGSPQRLPTSWTPIGSPSFDFVSGSTTLGLPVRLNGHV